MKKIYVVAVALLVFSLVLGVGTVVLEAGDEAALDAVPVMMPAHYADNTAFCDPRLDPNCGPNPLGP